MVTSVPAGGLRAGLIGCGGMGRGHARNAQQLGIEVIGFCDIIEAAAASACAEFGGQYATTDPDRIMRDDRINLLFIATHHDAHHPLALTGAQAGKHMLLEKPMCLTYAQAMEVAEAVERAGIKVALNHWFRLTPATQKTRELIPHPRISHGQLAMRDSRSGGATWVWRPDDGGGLVLSTASHTVDLLSFLMDSRAERVYAEGRLFDPQGKGDGSFYDGLAGTILWRNGGISTVISSDQGQSEYVSKWFHQVWDGQRSAIIHAHTRRVEFTNCEIDYLDGAELPPEERQKPLVLTNLLDAIHHDAPIVCSVRDGAHAVAICNALDEAARTGRPRPVRS
ncbi:MAG: Gfo/Idh/MocA family protein [Chloroflexota bacterium]